MNKPRTVRVRDITIRFFHWRLIIGFAVAYPSGESEGEELHTYAGYLVGGLLCYRLVWGFIGTRYARFSSFVFSARETIAYIGGLLAGQDTVSVTTP